MSKSKKKKLAKERKLLSAMQQVSVNASKKNKLVVGRPQRIQSAGAQPITIPNRYRNFGSAVGSYLGGKLGTVVGAGAADMLARITGWGDYRITGNTVLSGNVIPSFQVGGDGMEVCHREYISDITGSTNFSISSYNINPGLASTFPWLSSVAQNFEEYEMLGLVFEYRPLSGSIATTSPTLGAVVYATNYDVLDPAFTSKQAMESYQFSNSIVPFESMIHPVECAPQTRTVNKRYIRSTNAPSNSDLRLYDLGLFSVGTQGMQSSYVAGELWVSYHVRLSKPRISPTYTVPWYHYFSQDAASATAFGTGAEVLSSTWSAIAGSTSGVKDTTHILLSNVGYYNLSIEWTNTSAPITAQPSITYGANLTLIFNGFFGASNQFTVHDQSAGGEFATAQLRIQVLTAGTGADNKITVSSITGMATAYCDVLITVLNSEFL